MFRTCTYIGVCHYHIDLYWPVKWNGPCTLKLMYFNNRVQCYSLHYECKNAESVHLWWCFSETEDSCKVCCRSRDGLCTPYVGGGKFLYLRKGKPCTVGFCDGDVSALLVCLLEMIIYQT